MYSAVAVVSRQSTRHALAGYDGTLQILGTWRPVGFVRIVHGTRGRAIAAVAVTA